MITSITIYLLLIDGLVVSLVITNAIMRWNVFPPEIEGFAWSIIIAFQVIVFLFYITAWLSELQKLNTSIRDIISILTTSTDHESELEK